MTNPNNAIGTNAAFNGRTTPAAFNDALSLFTTGGIVSGWACSPSDGMTVSLGGDGEIRDVAIAVEPTGNRATINNRIAEPVDITLADAPAMGTRIDAIVAYVNNPPEITENILADNPECCGIIAVAGTPDAGTPVVPTDTTIRSAITADGGVGETAYYVILATIQVATGTTTITADLITAGETCSVLTDDGYTTTTVSVLTSDWSSTAGITPFKVSAVVDAGYNITSNSEVELINNQAVLFATYGFAIASVDTSTDELTIYALNTPASDVSLVVRYKEGE